MSWPVTGTLMIEPTESESKVELDRFCDALIGIHGEIQEIIEGTADKENNVLKHAPHTAQIAISDTWDRPYSREKAAYPMEILRSHKFWPYIGALITSMVTVILSVLVWNGRVWRCLIIKLNISALPASEC